MNPSQQTREENFSEEEKARLKEIFSKKLLTKSVIYFFLIGGSISVIIYFNFFTAGFDNLGLVTLAFLTTIALCGRIYISNISEYRKETKSPAKKVIETRIVKREGEIIFIGNQQFKRENILLDVPDFDKLKADDKVRVEHSAKSHTIFSIKKI
jgi:hypothetical protein